MATIIGYIIGIILIIVWLPKLIKKLMNKEVQGKAITKNYSKEEGETKTVSAEKLVIKMRFWFFWLGLIAVILFFPDIFEFNDGYLRIYFSVLPIVTVIAGMLLMILSLPRGREIVVEYDDINITTMFILKKHFRFSDIVHCKKKFNGWEIYVANRKRKAFFMHAIFEGAGLFMKRIEDMNIPIE